MVATVQPVDNQYQDNTTPDTTDPQWNLNLVAAQPFANQLSADGTGGNSTAISSAIGQTGYDPLSTSDNLGTTMALAGSNPAVNYNRDLDDRSALQNQLQPGQNPTLAQVPRRQQPELNDNFSRDDNTRALEVVQSSSPQIRDAANQYNVAPEVVSAILFEEARRYGADDVVQDASLRATLNFGDGTYGRAQMNSQTLEGLIQGGYLDGSKHTINGFNLMSRSDYNALSGVQQAKYAQELLQSDAAAPYLIAAYSRQTIDTYKAQLPSIAQQPLNGNSVRDTNHYRILTQVYSTGPGQIQAGIDRRITEGRDPNELRRYADLNARGIQAVSNYFAISDAYYGAIRPFSGALYNTTPGGFGNRDY